MQSSLLDIVRSTLDGPTVRRIANQIGASPAATARATTAALPALIGALDHQSASPAGASSLLAALDRDHDGSLLDDLGALLGGSTGGTGKALDGAGILGHLLGGRRGGVESKIGEATGLGSGQIARLLEILAPIVMAALAKARRTEGGGLGDILGKATQGSESGLGGMLGSLLDQDGDGDPTDDLARLGTSVLGGLFGGRS